VAFVTTLWYDHGVTSPSEPRLRIFFSHSNQDADWVERAGAQATAAGVEVYLAEHDVSPGQQLSQKITEAIEASDAVIVLLSKNSLASVYVHQEIGVAHHAGKLVIPILMEEVVGTDLGFLNGREYVLLDRAAPHDGLSKLSVALTQLIEQQRQMIDEAQERLRQQTAAEAEARQRQQLAEMQRRNQQDSLVVGGVLMVLGLIIMSQNAG
jgi:hypothetical protein